MRKLFLGGLVATAALGSSILIASSANADTVSSAADCVPVKASPAWTETQYKFTPVKNGAGPTYWSVDLPTSSTQKIKVNGVDYMNANSVRKLEHPAVAGVTCAVTLPGFDAVNNGGQWSATVPLTPHVKTYLYGVQGHPETEAITSPVTVTPDMVGGQFWIGYQVDEGYVATNAGTTHVDFAYAAAVTLPQFSAVNNDGQWSATVPLTPHVRTFLYGVQGYDQNVPITSPVTVTPDMAGQFWIGYVPEPGYVASNTGTTHIDFNAAA